MPHPTDQAPNHGPGTRLPPELTVTLERAELTKAEVRREGIEVLSCSFFSVDVLARSPLGASALVLLEQQPIAAVALVVRFQTGQLPPLLPT
jgi:hypothetical protein